MQVPFSVGQPHNTPYFFGFQVAADVQPVVEAPAPAPEVVNQIQDLDDPGEAPERRGFKNEFKLEVIQVSSSESSSF